MARMSSRMRSAVCSRRRTRISISRSRTTAAPTERRPSWQEFARADSRVRLHNATEFVPVVASHNRAFTLISDDAAVLQGSRRRRFALSELPRRVGRSGRAASLDRDGVLALRVRRQSESGRAVSANLLHSGREISRLQLLGTLRVFGAPSTSLLRASILREKRPFYHPLRFHAESMHTWTFSRGTTSGSSIRYFHTIVRVRSRRPRAT